MSKTDKPRKQYTRHISLKYGHTKKIWQLPGSILNSHLSREGPRTGSGDCIVHFDFPNYVPV